MRHRSARTRRIASSRQLTVLRAAGWRYSVTRDAWVHRLLGGRIGPVFTDEQQPTHEETLDLTLTGWIDATERAHAIQRERRQAVALGDLREVTDEVIDLTARPLTPVQIQLTGESDERIILVDGRPPRLDPVPSGLAPLPMRTPTRASA